MQEQDVTQVSSPVEEPVSETSVEETTPQTTAEKITPQPPISPSPEGVNEEGEVDEKGIPYKNRFMEAQRKLEQTARRYTELEGNLPNIVEQAIAKAIPQTQTQQPQYTKEQLIEFKNSTEDTRSKSWAEMELEKLRNKEIQSMFEGQRKKEREEQTREAQRRSAFQQVYTKYPVMFNQDGSWNNAHPLTSKLAGKLNTDKALQEHPSGVLAAADMAFSEWILEQQPNLVAREQKLKRQVKKLQTTTLVEGAGQQTTVTPKSSYTHSMEHLAKTGDKKALKGIAAELLKDVHPGLV